MVTFDKDDYLDERSLPYFSLVDTCFLLVFIN